MQASLCVYVLSVCTESDRGTINHSTSISTHHKPHRLQLPESEMRAPILGLNLLYLLVENRLAEFHSEARAICLWIERIGSWESLSDVFSNPSLHIKSSLQLEHLSEAERGSPYISFPLQLEQHLMVGSYHKVRPTNLSILCSSHEQYRQAIN
jgi:hypothetical protein